MSHRKLLAALPAAALYAALSGFAPQASAQASPSAATAGPETSSAASTGAASGKAAPPAGQQGMVVVRDAQTGQLRAPTPAESRALAPAPMGAAGAIRAPSQPALVTHPSGARQVRLGERGLVYSVVTRGADGKLSEQCVHGAAAAEKAVTAPQSSTPHTEEHRHEVR